MTTLQIIILTILAQQIICAIVYFVSGENNETTAIVSFGFVYAIMAAIGLVIYRIRLLYSKHNYNWYQFYDGDECPYHINNYLIHKSIIDKFRNVIDDVNGEITEPQTIRFLRSCDSVGLSVDKINNRTIKNQKNVYGMKWTTLKKFLK